MQYIKGDTTARNMLDMFLSLKPEDLDKPIIMLGRFIERPIALFDGGKLSKRYEGKLILDMAAVGIHNIGNSTDRGKNTPPPIIKDGITVCPCCGAEVIRSPEVLLSYPPIYTYYCTKCIYIKEIRAKDPIKEARVDHWPFPNDDSLDD